MKEQILKIKHSECYVVPESDYGKAEVYRLNDVFILFSIPWLGGPARMEQHFSIGEVDKMIKQIES